MKKNKLKIFSALLIVGGLAIGGCSKSTPGSPTVYYQEQDQVGRPAINTVFNAAADKQTFNETPPSAMSALFGAKFLAKLMALNPGYTTNALGLNDTAFTNILVNDVLNVSTTGTTTFFNPSPLTVLTGRQLSDDVIHTELLLIFGGPDGTANPGLSNDNVPQNDKTFLTSFPYEAAPW